MQSRVSFSGVRRRDAAEEEPEDRRQDRANWELEGAEDGAGGTHKGSPEVEPGGLSLSRRPGESGPVLSAAAAPASRPGVVELAPAIDADFDFDINDFDFETVSRGCVYRICACKAFVESPSLRRAASRHVRMRSQCAIPRVKVF